MLNSDIDENWEIYFYFPRSYSPKLSKNNNSLSTYINLSQTMHHITDDHLLVLTNLTIS